MGSGQTGAPSTGSPDVAMVALSLLLVAAAVALATWYRRRGEQRTRAVARLLDSADALEAGDQTPGRAARQELRRQRLWLQQHGQAASLEQLDSVRASIDAARESIDDQLVQIERARASLH